MCEELNVLKNSKRYIKYLIEIDLHFDSTTQLRNLLKILILAF